MTTIPITNKILLRGRVKELFPSIKVGNHVLIKLAIEVPRAENQFGLNPASTDTICVQTWDNIAEFCSEHIKPDSFVFIEAHINYSTWTDKQTGEPRGIIVINAIDVCPSENFDFSLDDHQPG